MKKTLYEKNFVHLSSVQFLDNQLNIILL